MHQFQQVICFSCLLKCLRSLYGKSVDPDQMASIAAICSGSTLFAWILKFASNVRQLFPADDFSKRHFQISFLGPLRVKK